MSPRSLLGPWTGWPGRHVLLSVRPPSTDEPTAFPWGCALPQAWQQLRGPQVEDRVCPPDWSFPRGAGTHRGHLEALRGRGSQRSPVHGVETPSGGCWAWSASQVEHVPEATTAGTFGKMKLNEETEWTPEGSGGGRRHTPADRTSRDPQTHSQPPNTTDVPARPTPTGALRGPQRGPLAWSMGSEG